MGTADNGARFEDIDWSGIERSRTLLTAERVTFIVGMILFAAVYWYDREIAHVYLVADWNVSRIDWVFIFSCIVVVSFVVVPLIKRRRGVARILKRLRRRPSALFGLGFLGVLGFLGIFAPVIGWGPNPTWEYSWNPPVGFTAEISRACAGPIELDGFYRVCEGTWQFPLGTNRQGEAMQDVVLAGMRPAVYVIIIGAVMVVPLATAVGVIAGLRGGLIDKLLMSYVDLQLSVPAIFIYFIAYMYWGPSLLILLLAFAMFSWGGIARLVRSEVIQRREHGHVTVARSLGASRTYLAKRHIIPNITNTLVPAVAQFLALLVLYEAGVAFLGFYEVDLRSWGATISQAINAEVGGLMHPRPDRPATEIWWVSAMPALALITTMVSFKLLGDGLRDALDPRGEH